MQQPHNLFIEWYNSLKVVKANKGPANGSIATALVVLTRLEDDFNLDFAAHIAEGGMQIKGASGAAVATILKAYGEDRPFAKEGGRTNRGGPSEIKSLLEAERKIQELELYTSIQWQEQLQAQKKYLVERVKDFHNRQKLKLTFNPALSTWYVVSSLLQEATNEGKAGYVAQHLVGAKLQLRFPNIKVSNESGSTADMQTQRPGDFLIGQTPIHVTVAPMPPVFEKCKHNILQGLSPLLLVPDNKLLGARQIAEQICEHQISVESIESFVSQNINEISIFSKDLLVVNLRELITIYNQRVDAVETDKSLMIELPSNLL